MLLWERKFPYGNVGLASHTNNKQPSQVKMKSHIWEKNNGQAKKCWSTLFWPTFQTPTLFGTVALRRPKKLSLNHSFLHQIYKSPICEKEVLFNLNFYNVCCIRTPSVGNVWNSCLFTMGHRAHTSSRKICEFEVHWPSFLFFPPTHCKKWGRRLNKWSQESKRKNWPIKWCKN